MPRNRFAAKNFSPRRANGAKGLIFTPVKRCDGCGSQYQKPVPAQCPCGSIAFTHFDSKAEARRWSTLLFLAENGKISNLRRQVHIPLYAPGPDGLSNRVGKYIADFDYDDQNGKRVIEDVKGLITDLASWKIRHVKAQFGIDVLLTK